MENGDLLRCLVHVIGRVAIPIEQAREIVGTGHNRLKAFNMCDGTKTIADIARATRIDSGNLSRAVANWVEHGIAFWVGGENDERLLHIYPIPKADARRARRGGRG